MALFLEDTSGFKKKLFLVFTLSFLFLFSAFSQIKVTFPVERSVFQRVNNVASIHIGGNIPFFTDEIQARLLPIQGGQAVDWRTINATIGSGNFIGELDYVVGGWYKLEVRALAGGVQVGETNVVNKVGVGEVFIISGQSNAQGGRPPMGGFYDNTAFGASDDRVNCVDFFNTNEAAPLPFPKISQLKAETLIAPHGYASWCWGLLGDKISKELNVPVLFFNAGEGGTRINQWAKASRGEETTNYYSGKTAPLGWPYTILKSSLQYYASIFGLRAVLWHQGEDDSSINTDPNAYKTDLVTVIEKTRIHSGKNVSWMVAKISRSQYGVKEPLKAAQQSVIDKPDFNVFQGPDTDDIQPSVSLRDDGIHFHGSGLIELADVWAKAIINEKFLITSKPFLANSLVKISTDPCQFSYQINASLPSNYKEPTWVWNNGNSRQQSASKTLIAFDENYGLVKDANDNILISPPFSFTPPTLDINLGGPTKICAGQSLSLIANTLNNNYLWDTGEKSKTISLSKPGDYRVTLQSKDIYGCIAKTERAFNLQVLALPPPPIIEAASKTVFCDGEKVEIVSRATSGYTKYWSTAETTNTIFVTKSSEISLQNIDANGCKSDISNIIKVVVNQLPSKPVVSSANSKNQFCDGDSLKLTTTKSVEYLWKTDSNTYKTNLNEFFIKIPGTYQANTINEYGCISPISDPITIKALKLPAAPLIEIVGKSLICAGDSTIIQTQANANGYSWFSAGGNIEASTSNKLAIKIPSASPSVEKTINLKVVDENGCVSASSNLAKITVKENPTKPKIDKRGPYTLTAAVMNNVVPDEFLWLYNGKEEGTKAQMLKATQPGNYSLKLLKKYTIDGNTVGCFSEAAENFTFDFINDAVILFPNPVVGGVLHFEALENSTNTSFRLINLSGQEVFTLNNINTLSRNSFYLGNLSGFFIAEIRIGGKLFRKNIFINNS